MKQTFFVIVVGALCMIFIPQCLRSCDEKEGTTSSCEVEYVWTITGQLEPVMSCKSRQRDASVE